LHTRQITRNQKHLFGGIAMPAGYGQSYKQKKDTRLMAFFSRTTWLSQHQKG